MNSDKSISVILAGYNEEQNIERAMVNTYDALKSNFSRFELILVDDASKDNTLDIMTAFAERRENVKVLPNFVNLNFGASVLRGINAAENDIIVFNACDLPLSVEDMIRSAVAFNTEKDDVVVLERTDYKTTKWRGITSDINKLMLKLLFPNLVKGTPVLNFVQIFNKRCVNQIVPLARSPIFVWPEMIFRAKILKLNVRNVRVKCHVENVRKGAFGHPHDIIWGIYDMLRFRLRVWMKKY